MRRLLSCALLIATFIGCASSGSSTPRQRRLDLLRLDAATTAGQAALQASLDDEDALVRRTAVRLLAAVPETPDEVLSAALTDDDVLVRRTGLAALLARGGDGAVTEAGHALSDSSVLVRLAAVEHLASLRPHSDTVLELLGRASLDADDKVRVIATRATWPFFRDGASVRDRQTTDVDLQVAQQIPLPAQGWRFRLDPNRQGHRLGWHEEAFVDGEWDSIAIEQAWQKAGYDYIGVTWYRRTIDLPPEPDHRAVDLSFGGVDESAWVWVNGHYAGDHDVGPSGWNDPFRLDVTSFLRWGAPNQITVRAMNTAHAGGIWKPVTIEVLR